jgi:shikimate 5-dehydrogenase
MKCLEIGGSSQRLRFDFLASYLKGLGHSVEFDYIETTQDAFPEKIEQAMLQYQHIRVSSPFGEKVHEFVNAVPMDTMTQRSSDCLIFDQGEWWARSMLSEGLVRELASMKKLDISETAMIVGAGASCRAVIAALLKVGFKKFNITEKFEERGRLLMKDLKETYFGVDFRFTPQSSITQLPGVHSVVINTTPFTPNNDLLHELYYCNFLKPEGIVIDLTMIPFETPLIKAALQVGARVVHGCEVSTLVDAYWVKSSMKISLNHHDYEAKLKAACVQAPFDLSGFDIPEF